MNFIRTLFGIVLISFHVQKISGKWNLARRNTPYGPLAVLEEEGDPRLEIAIPQKYGQRRSVAAYFSNEDEKLEEEKVKNNEDEKPVKKEVKKFRTACPSNTQEQIYIEALWRQKVDAPNSRLFFLTEYQTGEEMECEINLYNAIPVPSIQKTKDKCANSQGDIYIVGYPVSRGNEKEVNLVITYEMCYSEDKEIGVIYTKHGLYSPGLMLLKVRNHYEPSIRDTFKSPLDSQLKYGAEYYENEYIYQFVPTFDMPTVLWENTTLFFFNYTPIGASYEIFEGMSKYDNVIRFFNKQAMKQLIVFSGTFQTKLDPPDCSTNCENKIPINYFWRVIFDFEKNATILVTQYTEEVCGKITPYSLCDVNDAHFEVIQEYNNGGCTYRCSVNHELLRKLNLEERTISGNLDISYIPKPISKKPRKKAIGGESDAGEQSPPEAVSITNFSDAATFALAVVVADSVAAQAMIAEGAMVDATNAVGDNEGGTHHEGTNDGHGDGQGEGQGGE